MPPWDKYKNPDGNAGPWSRYGGQPSSEPGVVDKFMQGDLMKGLGYVGGLTRTSFANRPEVQAVRAMGEGLPAVTNSQNDFKRALVADAPTTSEYLGRGGVPAGPVREAVGAVGDFALDIPLPITAARGGIKGVGSGLGVLKELKGSKAAGVVTELAKDLVKETPFIGPIIKKAEKYKGILSGVAKKSSGVLDDAAKGGSQIASPVENVLKKTAKESTEFATRPSTAEEILKVEEAMKRYKLNPRPLSREALDKSPHLKGVREKYLIRK